MYINHGNAGSFSHLNLKAAFMIIQLSMFLCMSLKLFRYHFHIELIAMGTQAVTVFISFLWNCA